MERFVMFSALTHKAFIVAIVCPGMRIWYASMWWEYMQFGSTRVIPLSLMQDRSHGSCRPNNRCWSSGLTVWSLKVYKALLVLHEWNFILISALQLYYCFWMFIFFKFEILYFLIWKSTSGCYTVFIVRHA